MHKKIYCIFACLLSTLTAIGQVAVIGTGTSSPNNTLYGPIYRFSAASGTSGSRSNMLFTQAELSAAGLSSGAIITSIEFNKTNNGYFLIPVSFDIYANNSSTAPPLPNNITWASITSSYTNVYSSTSYNVPTVSGWVNMSFTTPFTYTGGSLELAFQCNMTAGSTGATDNIPWEYTNGFATSIAGVTPATNNTLSGTTSNYKQRPNIKINYIPGTPCTGIPVAGAATADNTAPVCPYSTVVLNLTGNTVASGISYEWESSPTLTPFTPTSLGTPDNIAIKSITPATTAYYRAKVSCNAGTPSYSTPVQVQVLSGLPGGTYTINNASPTGGSNFNSFADAITAMNCGITGPIVFNVVAGSGPYVETVSLGSISGSSAANTVTFKGNGNTVQFDNTSSERQLLTLSGTHYVTFDSLTFKALDATYGWGALITNGSAHDSIKNCTFDLTAITTTSSSNCSGIAFSSSSTSPTSSGNNGSNCYIGNNKILCTTGSGGSYYTITLAGQSENNIIEHNLLENFYLYGFYLNDAANNSILNNELTRASKTSVSTFYGIYATGTVPGTVIAGNRLHDVAAPNTSTSSSCYMLYITGDGSSSNPIKVYNNEVYNANSGGTFYGGYLSYPTYVDFYHNTIILDQVTTGTSSIRGIYATGSNTGINIKNNLIAITAGNQGTKHGIYYSTAASVTTSQRNNVYVNSNQTGAQSYGYLTTNYATLNDFQQANPTLENGSIAEDPQILNAGSGDLTPTNYLLYGAGENLLSSVPKDINGANRNTSPTPGAIELPLPPLNNVGTIALINPTSPACTGTFPLAVSVINAGVNTVNTMQINWKLNGVLQPPYSYTGPLYAISNTSGQSIDTATIGNLTIAPNSVNDIVVWTSNPNNTNDTDPVNDTLFTMLHAAMNGTYTINPAMPASTTNYVSFASFTNDLQTKGVCGPVVAEVSTGSGDYNELLNFTDIQGVSAVNTITIKGHGAQLAYDCDVNNRQLLTIKGTSFIRIDSLNFKTLDATYGWGAILTNTSFDSITNCNFDLSLITSTSSLNSNGIVFSSSITSATSTGADVQYCYIANNKITGPAGAGGPYYSVSVTAGSNNNVFEKNELADFYNYGFYISGASNTTVKDNSVHRSGKTTVSSFNGIYITGTVNGTKVTGNRIYTPGGTSSNSTSSFYGIYNSSDGIATNRNLIANNLIYNINMGGTIYPFYASGALEADYIHNTADLSATPNNTSTSATYGFYFTGTNTNTRAYNNIVNLTGGTLGTKYGAYFNTTASIADAQRNNWYVNSTQAGTQNYCYYGGTAYATIADFQTANAALEAGSVSVDPQFASAATGFYLPLNTALASNGSNTLNLVPDDIIGVARTTTPTPGAFQVAAAYTDNAGVTALINPSDTFCSGPRPVSVTIKNYGLNDINNMQVNWTINGVVQPAFNYAGTLGGLYSGNNTAQVNIGTGFFPAGMASEVKAWTFLPNGNPDAENENDTFTTTVQPSYSVVVNLGNDTAVCQGNMVTLDAGNSGLAYNWSNGATTQTVSAMSGNTYFVTATDNDGCMGSDTIQINAIPLPVVDLGNDRSICPGNTAMLDAGNAGAVYTWSTGATSQMITVTTAGAYSVNVMVNQCSSADTVVVAIIDGPESSGINAVYSDDATYFFNPIDTQFAVNYTWDFGDGSPTEAGYMVQHTYAANGIYTVTCTLQGICDSGSMNISRTVDVFDATGTTGIKNIKENRNWTVYPNPANNVLTIANTVKIKMTTISVYTVTGRLVKKIDVNSDMAVINVAEMAPGMYVLKVNTADNDAFFSKITIRK